MSKKNFSNINNPALQFISTSEPVEHKSTQEPNIPKGQVKESAPEKEMKTRRMQLLVRPSLHDALKKLAAMKQASVNDLVNQALENLIEQNKEIVDKYNDVFGH